MSISRQILPPITSPAWFALALTLSACSLPDDGDDGASGDDATAGSTAGTDGPASDSTPDADTGGTTEDPPTTADETGSDDDTGGMAGPNPCELQCADMPGMPPAGLGLVKSAGQEPAAHCGTLYLGISEDDSVAVFSGFQTNVTFGAEGDGEFTVSDLRLIPGGVDGQDLEWGLLSDAELSLPPLTEEEYVGHTITADDPLSFTVELRPAASGAREACLALSTEEGDDYLVTVTARGSDSPLLNFSPHVAVEDDTRFGARTNLDGEILAAMSNEAHEPGIVDSTGATYTIGRNVGPGGFAEVTAIAKRNPDGSWAWMKLLEGRDGETQVDAKLYQVSDETADFGSSHTVVVDEDDNLFILTNVGVAANSDITQATVVKLDPEGNVLWSRGWVADPAFPAQANDEANFQAMALAEGKIIVTGQTGGSNTVGAGIPIVGLDAESGDLLFNHVFQIDAGGTQTAFAIAVDGDRVYIGGQGARAFVAALSGLDSDGLMLDWTQRIDLGFTGTRVRSLTMAEGDLCGLGRGISTQNMFHMFCLDADGNALWNRQLGNLPSSRTRSQVITYADGSLYAGGAIAVSGLDPFGEGLLLRTTLDGELDWSAIYYTGKGAEEIGFHSVKGITVRDGQLQVQGQAWTGPLNTDWYRGFWYDGEDVGLEWSEFADNADYAYDYGLGDLLINDQGTLLTDTSAYLVFTDIGMENPADVEEGTPAYLFQPAGERRGGPGGDYDGLLQTLTEVQ